MTEGTVITEREVRNQRAMINDTILVGTCSGHHQHYTDEDRPIKDDTFGYRDASVLYREGIHVVAAYHTA